MSVWTEEMDAELLRRRRERRLPWRAVFPIGGMGKTACQKRFEYLTSDVERPGVKVAARTPKPSPDGLVWLQGRKRLSAAQLLEAWEYRRLFRDAGDLSMKSQIGALLDARGGGAGGADLQTSIVGTTAARRRLFILRHQVLRTQTDMLTVMDGVCGVGHTLRDLAGGDKHRARDLEVILGVALDLLAAHRTAAKSSA
jgi:hypothetical protein